MVGPQFLFFYYAGYGVCRADFHFLIDLRSSDVKGSSEYSRKSENIIYLVREITPARTYDGGSRVITGVLPDAGDGRAHVGLFGYSAGTLRDIVYRMDGGALDLTRSGSGTVCYVGGLVGGKLFQKVPVVWLKRAFALLILYGAWRALAG